MGPARATARRLAVVGLVMSLTVLWASGVAGAAEVDQSERPAGERTVEEPAPAGIELTVAPVIGDDPDDGDLVAVDADWQAALFFSPTAPVEQRAVFEFMVRNTGDVPLHDLAVTDERIGTVIDAADGIGLAPGEEKVVRAAMTVTFDDAAGDLGGLLTWATTATSRDEGGAEVTAGTTTRLEVVAVLASPSAELVLEVLPEVEDVMAGDPPMVQWSAGEAAAGEVRMARYRVTVTNTSSVDLTDLQVAVDVLPEPLVAASEAVVLAPGEQLVRTFDRELRGEDVDDVAGGDVELLAVATLTAVEAFQGQELTATDEAVLRAVLLPAEEVVEVDDVEELPAAGLSATTLVTLAVALLLAGTVLVGRGRRPTARRAT